MRTLSITGRLGLTFAALSAGALLLCGASLYWMESESLEALAASAAQHRAERAAEGMVRQWDEDARVEFVPGGVSFDDVGGHVNDWAVVQPIGRVMHRSGLFEGEIDPLAALAQEHIASTDHRRLRFAAAPLPPGVGVERDDLPPAVISAIRQAAPSGLYLRAKREASGNQSIFEVRFVQDHAALVMKVAEDGALVRTQEERFPDSLPPDLAEVVGSLEGPWIQDRLNWSAWEGDLVAIVAGRRITGEEFRIAINRMGERFRLDAQKEITGREEGSRILVLVAVDSSREIAAKRSFTVALCVAGTGTWLLFVFAGWFIARRAMSPVQAIVDAAARIRLSNLRERLPVGPVNDELTRISTTINTMLDRLERSFQRERRFTGDAAHELRGPVAKVLAEIELSLTRDRSGDEYRQTMESCRTYVQRMQRLIESLLFLARADENGLRPQMSRFDTVDLVVVAISSLPAPDAARVRVEVGDDPTPLHAIGDPSLLGVLLRNLLDNALRYSPADRRVEVRLGHTSEGVRVAVADEGEGIPEDDLKRVFDRFYRVDASRAQGSGGVGLGLAIVETIAKAHGFEVTLSRTPSGGTEAGFVLAT